MRDLEMIDERRRISASRLIDGGPAILLIEARNHHIDILGRIVISPFVRNRLRVFVKS